MVIYWRGCKWCFQVSLRVLSKLTFPKFTHPDEFAPAGDADENYEPEVDLFLGSGTSGGGFQGRLQDHHPPMATLHSLKEIFVDRIDPLLKILHMPTFWQAILQSVEKQVNTPSYMEAAIFCFYFATISVLGEEECGQLFGEKKITLFAKYRTLARHALGKAGLLSTSNPMTLRAFALFMVCVRAMGLSCLRSNSLFSRWDCVVTCGKTRSI